MKISVKTVCVVGGGTMGSGIAQQFALYGFQVHLIEKEEQLLHRAIQEIERSMDRMIRNEKIEDAQKQQTLNHITGFVSLQDGVRDTEIIIEAVSEQFDLKCRILEEAAGAAPDSAILATNTSSIPITRLAGRLPSPERFIGMHFFNPVPVMQLVEVVRGERTAPEVVSDVEQLARKLGKIPVTVQDSPGFVSNRLLMPMINEAIFALYEGVASAEEIDRIMKLGMSHPMGPLRLADYIGLDICLDIMNVLYNEFKDPKYRPSPLLVRMVDAGKLGDKAGEGFYKHAD